jgi:hypothetical protein
MPTITLKNKSGQLFDYDTPEDANHAVVQLGYAPASAQEITAYDRAKAERERFGSTAQQALGLGELALGSASFGLLSPDSDEAKARRRQLRKQSPFLAVGAEAAGAAVPGLLTAGVGSALAEGSAVARTGAALASDFTSGLSLETEQAKEQQRKIDVGNVALWSLGGVMAENLVRAGFKGVSNFKNNALPSALNKAREFRAGAEAAEQTAEGAAKRANTPLPEPEVKRIVENWDEEVNNVRTVGRDAGNSFPDSFDQAHSITWKKEDIQGKIAPNEKLQARFADNTVDRAEALAAALDQRGAKKTAATVRRHIYEIESAEDAADLFVAADQLKRTTQKFRKKAAVGARSSGNDPFGELTAEFDAVEKPLRRDLEENKIWGKDVAEKQRLENKLWSDKKDGFIQNNAVFQDAFYSKHPAGVDYDGLPQYVWDDSKFLSFLKKDRIGQRDVLDAGHRSLDAAEQMVKVKEGLGIRPDDLIQLKTDVKDLRATLNRVSDLAKANQQGSALIERLKAKAGRSPTAAALGSTVGRVPVVGQQVAQQLDDFFNPATVKNLDPLVSREVARANLEGRMQTLGKAVQGAAPEVTASGLPSQLAVAAVRQTAEHAGASMTSEQVNTEDLSELSEHGRAFTDRVASTMASDGKRPAPLPDAPTRFQGSFGTLRDAYEARKALLTQAAQDPTVLIRHLSDSYGDLPDTHPQLFSELAARVMSGVNYLSQNLPPSVGYSMRDPAGLPPSHDAMREFARTWSAVFEPADTLRDVASGRATPKQLRALAAVHPDVFAQFQAQTIRKMSSRLKPPPYESQRYLDQVMQLQGAYSPAMSPRVALNIKNSLANAPANPEGLQSDKLQTSPSNPRGIASISSGPTFGS